MKVGVSTSTLSDKSDLNELLAYEPDLVEFYTYPRDDLPSIAEFCRRHGVIPALHVPTPYPTRMQRYCPTGPDKAEAQLATTALKDTVACAADLGAHHVVVHFPTPYPPFSREALDEFGPGFLAEAATLSRQHRVPVLIENMSPNPHCATAEQYAAMLAPWPELGLCLDVGHALRLGSLDAVDSFADALGERVQSIHLYDIEDEGPGHDPYPAPEEDRRPKLPAARLERVLVACQPSAVVLEHEPTPGRDVGATFRWLKLHRRLREELAGPES